MKKKLRVAILFGGRSAEHEISVISARNIVEAMDKRKYEIVSIGIDKQGRWFFDEGARLLHNSEQAQVKFQRRRNPTAVLPGATQTPMLTPRRGLGEVDVVFPVLHGPFGEDGTVQGLLKLANVPFVGAGVLGSAVGMDKDVMKRLLRDAKIPIAKFLVFERSGASKINFAERQASVGVTLLRQTGQSWFLRRHQQGQREQTIRRSYKRSFSLRQQDFDRRKYPWPRN